MSTNFKDNKRKRSLSVPVRVLLNLKAHHPDFLIINLKISSMKKVKLLLTLLVLFYVTTMFAQTVQISGTVTNSEDGLPIPGATVQVKGTTVGSITDFDGKYTVAVPEGSAILVYSFVGMKSIEREIAGQTVIDVILEPDVLGLDEVVVTAIGIKRETKALGYAVQSVDAEDLSKSNNPNILNSMNGKVAGVTINSNSGAAGGGSTILIRGAASITGENQPLFVIDGVPIDNSSYRDATYATEGVDNANRGIDLNGDDIESVNVLKGGAATALYGLRAANGAVIITTKKGKAGGFSVDFHSSYGWEEITMMHPLQDKYAQGSNGGFQNFGGTTLTWGPLISDLRYDGDTSYEYDQINGRQVLHTDPTATNKVVQPFDNVNEFFQTGHTRMNSINMGGGNEKTTFFVSYSNSYTEGVQPENTFEKNTFKISGQTRLGDKWTVGGNANYVNSGGIRVQRASNVSGMMLGLLRTSPNFDIARYYLPDGSQRAYSFYDNPLWSAENNQTEDNVHRLIGNVNASFQATDWLNFSYRLGIDTYTDQRSGHHAVGAASYPDGQVQESERVRTLINSDLLANINRDLTSELRFNSTLGFNMFQDEYRMLQIWGEDLQIPLWYHIDNASSTTTINNNQLQRSQAFFGDIGFEYKSMLFLNGTARYESSTTLPEENNTFLYPSISTGFVFTELGPLKSNPILSFGKLRASWAKNANVPGPYQTVTYYTLQTYDDGFTNGIDFSSFMGLGGFGTSATIGNGDLKPETQRTWEIGADLRFFQNRFSIDFTYYNQYNEDLIVQVPIASASGYGFMNLNAGEMENKGIELLLMGTPVKTSDFSWDVTVNYTRNRSMVVKLAEGIDEVFQGGFTSAAIYSIAGEPFGSIFGTYFLTDDNGNWIINDDPEDPNYGYPYRSADRKGLGNANPDWTMGITNSFTYKNFTVSALLDIKQGGVMFNFTKARLYTQGVHKDTENRGEMHVFNGVMGHYDDEGNLINSGQTNNIEVPLNQAWYTGDGGSQGAAEPFVEDASWVRLRNVNITYDLPESITSKTFINRASVYFNARNLWIDTPYSGIDPESSLTSDAASYGMEYFNTPGTKSYTLGLKLSF